MYAVDKDLFFFEFLIENFGSYPRENYVFPLDLNEDWEFRV
jgi:hypothetical protein